jgi:hypothetical protein
MSDLHLNIPASCPFCNGPAAKKERWISKQTDKSGMRSSKQKRYYYECLLCGAQTSSSEYENIALMNWNNRPSQVWTPLPEGAGSYLLPGVQKFGHLLVHEQGKVTLLDYIEEEVSPEGDGIAAQADVDLGHFRVCMLRAGVEGPLPPGLISLTVQEGGEKYLPELIMPAEVDEDVLEVIEGLINYALGKPNDIRAYNIIFLQSWINQVREARDEPTRKSIPGNT